MTASIFFAIYFLFSAWSAGLLAQTVSYEVEEDELLIYLSYSTSEPISEFSYTGSIPSQYVILEASGAEADQTDSWLCVEENCSASVEVDATTNGFSISLSANESQIGSGQIVLLKGIIIEVEDLIGRAGVWPSSSLAGRSINLYPNPTKGKLIWDFPQENEFLVYAECIDMRGNRVGEWKGNAGLQRLNLAHLPAQYYLMRIRSNKQNYVVRIQLID